LAYGQPPFVLPHSSATPIDVLTPSRVVKIVDIRVPLE
jgi:hypothetical protein